MNRFDSHRNYGRSINFTDEAGMPAGGHSHGVGFMIGWQAGPLGSGAARQEPNGAFVESIIEVCIDRIEFYDAMGFGCVENDEALSHLKDALSALNRRTARRIVDGTEGTHEGS